MFEFFKKGLSKTIDAMRGAKSEDKISKEILEEMLLEADVGYELVEEILEKLPAKKLVAKDDLKGILKSYFDYEITKPADEKPFVELIIGVNGAGKTTTTAKLANLYKNSGQSVILGACDTFRAGAVEQLRKWAQILNLPIVATAQGHDPAAVAFDTVSSASAKNIDRVLIDTAGRLQNQKNLAAELEKIVRICDRAKSGAPHRKVIVLDARGQLCVPCAECRGTSCKQRCVVAWWCQKVSSGMAGGKGNLVPGLSSPPFLLLASCPRRRAYEKLSFI